MAILHVTSLCLSPVYKLNKLNYLDNVLYISLENNRADPVDKCVSTNPVWDDLSLRLPSAEEILSGTRYDSWPLLGQRSPVLRELLS